MSLWMKILFLGMIMWVHLPISALAENVRVGILSDLDKLELFGTGIHIGERRSIYETVAIPQTLAITIRRQRIEGQSNKWFYEIENRLGSRLGSATTTLQGESQLPSRSKTQQIYSEYLSVQAVQLSLFGKSVYPRLLLKAKGPKIQVVAVVPFEFYLAGVLASEVPMSWPVEFLKAQAVAIRSYTLNTIQQRKQQLVQLEGSVKDQVFEYERLVKNTYWQKAHQVIEQTKNIRLTNLASGTAYKAYYHADCGGQTATSTQVWGSVQKDQGRSAQSLSASTAVALDPYCPLNPKAKWSFHISKTELQEKLVKHFSLPATFRLKSLQAQSLDSSPVKERIFDLTISFESSQEAVTRSMKAHDFRGLLGFFDFRSTKFEWEEKNNEFWFKGSGFGHGVGLCQWGASNMAKAGKGYLEILSHYYPQAKIVSDQNLTAQKLTTTRTANIRTTDITKM